MSAEKSGPVAAKIINRRGLHARAAARFARMAGNFTAEITVRCKSRAARGDSILELLMLGAGPGQDLLLDAEGPDREQAMTALSALIASGFDEKE